MRFKFWLIGGFILVLGGISYIVVAPSSLPKQANINSDVSAKLKNQVSRLITVKDRLEPTTDNVQRFEEDLKAKCSESIAKNCSKSSDLDSIVECLTQSTGLSLECLVTMNTNVQYPLSADRKIDGIIWPAGTVITRTRGIVTFATLSKDWNFSGIKCRKGSVWVREKFMSCYLSGDQTIKGIKFKSTDESDASSNLASNFVLSSGTPLSGLMAEDQVIHGIPVKGGTQTNFDERGRVVSGQAAQDFTNGRFQIKKDQRFAFSDVPSGPDFPGVYDCVTEMKQFKITKKQLKNLCDALPIGSEFEKMRNCIPSKVVKKVKSTSWAGVSAVEQKMIKPAIDECAGFDINFAKKDE